MKSKVLKILLGATLAGTALVGARVTEVKASETNVYKTVVWVTKQEDGKEKILKRCIKLMIRQNLRHHLQVLFQGINLILLQ